LTLLRAALIGDLLCQPFAPVRLKGLERNEKKKVGLVWASVGKQHGEPVDAEKGMDWEDLAEIVSPLKGHAEFIIFQRNRPKEARQMCDQLRDSRIADGIEVNEPERAISEVASLDAMVGVSNTYVHVAASINKHVVVLAARRQGPQWYWRAQEEHGK